MVEITITQSAISDLKAIHDYIALDSERMHKSLYEVFSTA